MMTLRDDLNQARCWTKNIEKDRDTEEALESVCFVPKDKLKELVTPGSVKLFLSSSGSPQLRSYSRDRAHEVLEYVCGKPECNVSPARQVFATLLMALSEYPELILHCLDDKIHDDDLPLATDDAFDFRLGRRAKDGKFLPFEKVCAVWTRSQRESFYNCQMWMCAPVLQCGTHNFEDHPTDRFCKKRILPWLEHEIVYGGSDRNSEVSRVKIHEAHTKGFPVKAGKHQSFALKMLRSSRGVTGQEKFMAEVHASLKIKPNEHLANNLLTTFQHGNQYYLLSEWADGGTLAKVWEEEPKPRSFHQRRYWLIQQCYGLADALDGIHDTGPRIEGPGTRKTRSSGPSLDVPFDAGSPSSSKPRKRSWEHAVGREIQAGYDAKRRKSVADRSVRNNMAHSDKPPVQDAPPLDDQKLYGRHGDIKPDNILCFNDRSESNAFGIRLKLADFGLTKFHGARTTRVRPNNKFELTEEYAPPEWDNDFGRQVNRVYDIWSLGCLFLELVTWILLGPVGRDEFMERRLDEQNDTRQGYSRVHTDRFYQKLRTRDGLRAGLKPAVDDWIDDHLKCNSECNDVLSEFIDYVRENMLVIQVEKRSKAKSLKEALEKMLSKVSIDSA